MSSSRPKKIEFEVSSRSEQATAFLDLKTFLENTEFGYSVTYTAAGTKQSSRMSGTGGPVIRTRYNCAIDYSSVLDETVKSHFDEYFSKPENKNLKIAIELAGKLRGNGIEWYAPQEKQQQALENKKTADEQLERWINTLIREYDASGKRYYIAPKHADRDTTINKLIAELTGLKELKLTAKDFYFKVAELINTARLETQASHRKNSWGAWITSFIRPTSSRLERRLDNLLKDLCECRYIEPDQLKELKSPKIVEPKPEAKKVKEVKAERPPIKFSK
jgi:hypothetical protein